MSDDRSKRGSQDRNRINLSEDYEVQYWSEKIGVRPERLREAVKKVRKLGPSRRGRTQARRVRKETEFGVRHLCPRHERCQLLPMIVAGTQVPDTEFRV